MHGKTRGRRLELLQSKALWKFEIVQKSPVLLDMCVCVCAFSMSTGENSLICFSGPLLWSSFCCHIFAMAQNADV